MPKDVRKFFKIYIRIRKSPQTRINTISINKKNTVPAAIALSAKTVFLVRLQGLEPWTP